MSQLSLRKGFAFVAAFLLVGAAVAIAVATHGSGGKTGALRVAKINAVEGIGARSESSDSIGAGEDPAAAAQEDYQNRSYPASDTPFQLTRNAQKAWTKLQSKNPHTNGTWTLAGPSTSNFPDVLTFSGAPTRPPAG